MNYFRFQNKSNLEEAIKDKTRINPVWIEAYNVAEIRFEDTVWGKKLGSGQFGTVWKGKITLENKIR